MPVSGDMNSCGSREQSPMCLRCTLTLTERSTGPVYASNEIVSGSGTITCNPGSAGPVVALFKFRDVTVASVIAEPGMEVAFSMSGFENIQVDARGRSPILGELLLMPVFSGI